MKMCHLVSKIGEELKKCLKICLTKSLKDSLSEICFFTLVHFRALYLESRDQ